MWNVAKEKLSDAFLTDFEPPIDGLKKASFHSSEQVLMEITQNAVLGKVISRNIERRTQSSTLMDTLAIRALTSSRFVRLVTKFF